MSMQNMEIVIPSEKSEVELLTAGNYCDKNITVKSPLGFKTVTGLFTPSEDTDTFSLTGLPSNVQTLEIRAETIYENKKADLDAAKLYFYYVCFTKGPNKFDRANDLIYNTYFQYNLYGPAGDYMRVSVYDSDNGTFRFCADELIGKNENKESILIADNDGVAFLFKGGVKHTWTAYCWDD